MNALRKMVFYLDKISDWSGKIVCWLIVPLVLGTTFDVIMRYFFLAPTKWAYELTWMEYGTLFMLGGAYTLRHRLHIRVDILYKRYSKRVQAWFDTLMYIFIFIPVFIILIKYSILFTAYSWQIMEHSSISYWQPPVYPIKTMLPVAFILMFFQGMSELIKNAILAIKGEEYES
jgi:TRAP-type mannitol/chloroaromatic compound transport system permease small subunit